MPMKVMRKHQKYCELHGKQEEEAADAESNESASLMVGRLLVQLGLIFRPVSTSVFTSVLTTAVYVEDCFTFAALTAYVGQAKTNITFHVTNKMRTSLIIKQACSSYEG